MGKGGNLREAESHVREALRLDPAMASNYCNLGVILWGQGKPGEAVPLFEKTLEIAPDYLAAHLNLAAVFESQGKYQGAAPCTRRPAN